MNDIPGTGDAHVPISLSIMIPAYLEGENLPFLLPKIKEAAAQLTPDYEILIVDTETDMDNTREVCAAHGVRHISRTGGKHLWRCGAHGHRTSARRVHAGNGCRWIT